MKYKAFTLGEDLFNIKRGLSKYTKKYGNKNKGRYPVYSASNTAPLTYINTFDFDGEYLTWATNGFAGYMKIISGKFSINADRGLLEPKTNGINNKYVKYKLEPILRDIAKGRKGERGEDEFTKVYPSMLSSIKIELPINSSGGLDIEAQNELAEKITFVEEIKQKIENYKKQIKEIEIDIKMNGLKLKLVKIKDIFEVLGEDNLTKDYVNSNKGEYPVYSGQIGNGGIFGCIKTYKYDETILTWVTYGNSGKIRKISGKFNIGRNNCGLRPRSKNIDLDYIKFVAEPIFISSAKGEKQKSLPQSIVKNIKIPIPADKNGNFDLKTQKEIAGKYKKIESIKSAIIAELNKISDTEIDL